MADDWQVDRAVELLQWPYQDTSYLRKALTAGDKKSLDREGNRQLAHCAEGIIQAVVSIMGYEMGMTRQQQHNALQMVRSAEEVARLARDLKLDQLIKLSPLQQDTGPNERILKLAMHAIVAAVWLQEKNWLHTLSVMACLGLICRPELDVNSAHLELGDSEFDGGHDLGIAIVPFTLREVPIAAPSLAQGRRRLSDSAVHYSNDQTGVCLPPNGPTVFSIDTTSTTSPSNTSSSENIEDTVRFDDASSDNAEDTQRVLTPENHASTSNTVNKSPLRHIQAVERRGTRATRITKRSSHVRKAANTSQTRLRGAEGQLDADQLVRLTADRQHYFDALMSIDSSRARYIANLLGSIGSSSAIMSLKRVIVNLRNFWRDRNSAYDSAVGIGRQQSTHDRVRAIRVLGGVIKHFQLARRLHIYKLYEEHAANHPVAINACAGGFLHFNGEQAEKVKGNPHSRAVTALTRAFMEEDDIASHAEANQLRKVAKRLHALVRTFGLGILVLIDSSMDETLIMRLTEKAFDEVIKTINLFEGGRIRALSRVTLPVINMLLIEHAPQITYTIEQTQDSFIERLQRCSPDIALLMEAVSVS